MSGTLPLALLMGDRLPSSGFRYLSFCRKTFETVLERELECFEQGLPAARPSGESSLYLRSTPKRAVYDSLILPDLMDWGCIEAKRLTSNIGLFGGLIFFMVKTHAPAVLISKRPAWGRATGGRLSGWRDRSDGRYRRGNRYRGRWKLWRREWRLRISGEHAGPGIGRDSHRQRRIRRWYRDAVGSIYWHHTVSKAVIFHWRRVLGRVKAAHVNPGRLRKAIVLRMGGLCIHGRGI
jgi:hypothetical protein